MTRRIRGILLSAALLGLSAVVHSQTSIVASRGQLLYSTHCVACHTTQVHWRDGRQAQDWNSLKIHVRRWQGNAGLQWAESDVIEVARHLNETIYHFPQTSDRLGMRSERAPP